MSNFIRHTMPYILFFIFGCGSEINIFSEDKNEKKSDDAIGSHPTLDSQCEWAIAESYPLQYFGTCPQGVVTEEKVRISLSGHRPSDQKFRITVVGENIELRYEFKESENLLIIDVADYKDQEITIRIAYTGDEKIDPPAPSTAGLTKGTVIDASKKEGCQYLIITEDGSRLEAMNLGREYRQDGLAIEFNYIAQTSGATICDSGTIVNVSDVREAQLSGEIACSAIRKNFQSTVSIVRSGDHSCEVDADCLRFGIDPHSSCQQPSFSSKSALDPHAALLAIFEGQIRNHCPRSDRPCAADFAYNPKCHEQKKICIGT